MAKNPIKSVKPIKSTKLENSKPNRNFLNWLIYHLSNGVSFSIAIEKTVKTFQNDTDRGKLFSQYENQIVRAAENLQAGCHNAILK